MDFHAEFNLVVRIDVGKKHIDRQAAIDAFAAQLDAAIEKGNLVEAAADCQVNDEKCIGVFQFYAMPVPYCRAVEECSGHGAGTYDVEALEVCYVKNTYNLCAESPLDAVERCQRGEVGYHRHEIVEGGDQWIKTIRVEQEYAEEIPAVTVGEIKSF